MTGDRRQAGLLLLALLSENFAIAPTDGDWPLAAQLAREHRLGPHLHGQLARRGDDKRVPADLAAEWQAAHRANGIAILAQRQAMAAILTHLAAENISAVALKGAALAWTVWPSPAERPMRDLDLLIPEHRAPDAYRVLREAGWHGPECSKTELAHMARTETHLPALYKSSGIALELHGHVCRSAPMHGMSMPRIDAPAVLARARYDERAGAAVPAPEDMLAHLVVHGACAHLFNSGPLLLSDVAYTVTAEAIDWPVFWDRATKDGFARAAALVFALVDRWRLRGLLETAACPIVVAPEQVDLAQALLFQSAEARKDINLIAGLRRAPGRAHRRLAAHQHDTAGPEKGALHLTRRAASLARSLADRPTRESGLATARIARWLEG